MKRFTTSDGLALAYTDEGEGQGTPILCLPGLTRNGADFDELAAALNGTRRLIRLTLRGRGASDRDPNAANYVAFGSAHAEVVDDLADPDSGGNLPNVHEKDGPTVKPVPYPLNHGLTRLRVRNPEESDRPGNPNPVILLREYRARNPLPTDRK